ncbi:Glycosyltransferase involved in cell wall bisynthesis [Sesbania bispinosa]|nr:Glycosyltransferase involved in cell wall bisynthesis [Sesbania bispinosa]
MAAAKKMRRWPEGWQLLLDTHDSGGAVAVEAADDGSGAFRWLSLIGESSTAAWMKSEARTVGGQRPGGAVCGGG